MSKNIIINGRVLLDVISGIPRYAYEILQQLDKLAERDLKIEIVIPSGTDLKAKYKNIRIRYLSASFLGFIWDYFQAERYAKSKKALYVIMAPQRVWYRNSIATVYDIRPLTFKERKITFRMLLFKLKFWIFYQQAIHRTKKIVTLSEFCKTEITQKTPNVAKKICTIGCGWEHIREIRADYSIFDDYPEIQKSEYFLSIGSIAPHKNFKWIIEVAKRNRDNIFVIVGGVNLKIWGGQTRQITQFIDNIIYVGPQSDEKLKALLINAKTLIFPSLYEGFGIPPLEALACGIPAIVSDIPVMHEIFGNTVEYINPNFARIRLNHIQRPNEVERKNILSTYTWKSAALKWKKLFINNES